MKRILVITICILASVSPSFSQTENYKSFSIGLDLVSLSYDQFLVYFETPITQRLNIDLATGYSPGGLWSSEFKYWYFQADLKNYLTDSGKGLYSGFGFASYFSQNPLEFSRWKTTLDKSSSVVVGVLGEIGYKYYLNNKNGLYFDSNLFVYDLSPIQINLVQQDSKSEFQYSQFSALGSVIAGYTF